MTETAGVLGGAALDKTIVLTGAMIPYSIANSDALFNLGFATAAAQTLPAGVYVAMNGRVFAWDKVTKNRGAMPNIDSAKRLLTLVAMRLNQKEQDKTRPRNDWRQILRDLHIHFGDRLPKEWGHRFLDSWN
jgi:L-asparaginase/Glu-tRNA(Gln) amidotransferase subunit D